MINFIYFIIFLMGNHAMANNFYEIEGIPYNIEFTTFSLLNKKEVKVAKHGFGVANSKKVLTLIHGLAENCGYMKPLIQFFTKNNYYVQCFEMPGHGMSTGDKYDIDDFGSYQLFFNKIITLINPSKHNVYLSHSTGAVGITQSLLSNSQSPFNKIILLAPLVRINYWPMVKLSHFFLSSFIDSIPRFTSKRGDGYHLARNSDPYLSEKIPVSWISKNIDYYSKVTKSSSTSNQELLILYGSDDEVIDWINSKEYYKEKFLNATIKVIPNGSHHLYFNHLKIESIFYEALKEYIK